jgi:hypothetical protein
MPTKKPEAKKKPEVKKSVAAKRKSGRKASAKSLKLEQLLALLPELDEEGLSFLLEQAKVHRYNMEAERLNALAEKLRPQEPSGGGSAKTGVLRIERSADGSTYHIVAGGDWKMFTAEEMAALVRISRCGEGEEEISRRLRAWFARERRDVYLDLGLDGPSIGMAKDLGKLILATFPRRA